KDLVVCARGYLCSPRIPVQPDATGVTDLGVIALARAGSLEGVIRSSGSWPSPRVVFALPAGGDPMRLLAFTDDAGWFSAESLAPGSYEVFAAEEGRAHSSTHPLASFCSVGTVTITAGVTSRIEAKMPAPATLEVTVASPSEEPGARSPEEDAGARFPWRPK